MTVPRRTGQLLEREIGPQRRLLRSRLLRVSALAAFGILLGLGLPFVFRSWNLFLALVVLLLAGGVLMLVLAIYQAGRR